MNISQLITKAGITPNEMQEATIDAVLNDRDDVVVMSPTGTGKTLAYLLPVAAQTDATSTALQTLVVVPGRELALQSDTVLKNIGSGIRSMACYGDAPPWTSIVCCANSVLRSSSVRPDVSMTILPKATSMSGSWHSWSSMSLTSVWIWDFSRR